MTDPLTTDGRITLAQGLVRGRSHIVFILGLLTAGSIIIASDRITARVGTTARTAGGPAAAAEAEAAAWAWAAAARSANPADVARARTLAVALGVSPQAAAPRDAGLSPAAGLAALEGLAARAAAPPPSAAARPVPGH
jgi:hypothetical protein